MDGGNKYGKKGNCIRVDSRVRTVVGWMDDIKLEGEESFDLIIGSSVISSEDRKKL